MTDINELSKTIAVETKVQGQKLTRVEQNVQETKTNMEAGNDQLDIKIKRDSKSNKCLIMAVAAVFAFVVIIIVLGF